MKRPELKAKIEDFYEALKAYRGLLSESRDAMVRIVRNGPELEQMRSDLNRKYGMLVRYIKKLGNYPMRSDVGGGPYPVYEIGLSADILQRRGPCIDATIQDLEYILGRIESMSEEEFDLTTALPMNPHQQYWTILWKQIWGWAKNHVPQIIVGVVIVVIGAIVIAWLGLNK